ncbi:hypothetical protein SAMN02745146_1160 [Hymenobacter daecheongensis DSM 21074]|uniref:TraB/GumN family protein n=1 Tax=Hymenobacter daecheongensis DSM 21074 TaxID=1121955 RepID=A0A1M6CHW1_9BACT|nr:DUF5694 domain-containing protein [Hymenobacter daecheongensis]SHI60579.1 hypothetical protein SAMN02745146_1160 [Hymenobacter daecheongensis DSM 21074]
MKKALLTLGLLAALLPAGFGQSTKDLVKALEAAKPTPQVEVLLLGSSHFGQSGFYKDAPKADLFSAPRQQEIAEINRLLAKFRPDMIMIEVTPQEQPTTDSLYTLYRTDKLQLESLPYGRAEQFQFGYRLAKQLGHPRVYAVDAYEGISNRILQNGTNIDGFTKDWALLSNVGKQAETRFKQGQISLREFLGFTNSPAMLDLVYRSLLVNAARVKQGTFVGLKPEDAAKNVTDPYYIGAEYMSMFYEREAKIYSNIVTAQQANQGKRLLVVMGSRHAATLSRIFANDPEYKVVPVSKYL